MFLKYRGVSYFSDRSLEYYLDSSNAVELIYRGIPYLANKGQSDRGSNLRSIHSTLIYRGTTYYAI